MHALLVHAYHLMRLPIHLAANPIWRPFAACLLAALGGRLTGLARSPRGAALTACIAVCAGWLVLAPPGGFWPAIWPPTPVGRLSGLSVILLVDAALRAGRKRAWLLPLTSAAAAWWLRGAPLTGPAILDCMPVFLGLLAAFPLARRLVRRDAGWATLAAAASLAAALLITGAAPHWARAALVTALTALALLGVPEAMPALAGMVVVAAAAALVASDRGRLIGVDAACLAPFLAWLLTPRLATRVGRHGQLVAGVLAALICIALAWAANRALAGR